MIKKSLFDYLDNNESVDIDQKGCVKIEVTELYADGVKKLISRLLENEGFEETKKDCANNMFFVHHQRFQILQVEFVGCTKRFKMIKTGGAPIFKITLKTINDKEQFSREMEVLNENKG